MLLGRNSGFLQIQPFPEKFFVVWFLPAAGSRWNVALERVKATMFRGTTIEELINSVERAEQHARDEQSFKTEFRDFPVRRVERREFVEVA